MKKSKSRAVSISYGSRMIDCRYIRSRRKSIQITVFPDLSVEVRAPLWTRESVIRVFLRKKASWIVSKLEAMKEFQPLSSPKKFVSGETFVYLGRQYRLKVIEGKRQSAKLIGRYLNVIVKNVLDSRAVERSIEKWYREKAKRLYAEYLKKCFAVASRHGVDRPDLTVRKMKRRWGSCSSRGGITINLNLIKVPVHCIEYVIMHEVCHMKYHNHGKRFYGLLTTCMPDWRSRKETLDRFRLE